MFLNKLKFQHVLSNTRLQPHPSRISPDSPHPSLFQFHSSAISSFVYFPSFSPKPPCLACQSHYSRHKIIPPSFKLKSPFEPPLLQSQLLPLSLPKHWTYFLLHTHIPFLSLLQSNQARQGKGETKHRGNCSSVLGHSPSSEKELQAKSTSDQIIHMVIKCPGTLLQR